MAKKQESFSMQLSDIPVPGNTGEAMGYISASGQSQANAGRSAGQAEAMGTQLTTGAIGTVFNTARDAYIGYETAKIETASEKAIAAFEDSPENVRSREAYEAVQAAEAKGVPLNDPTLVALKEQAAKYKRAMDQGFITQDEAILRMATAVKKASARMPGLQSEFRKAAANVSGINAVDIYAEHKALTSTSQRALAEAERAKAFEKYRWEVSQHFGLPPHAVTEKFMQLYAADKALKNEAARMESTSKMTNLKREEREQAFGAAVQGYVNADLVGLSGKLTEYNTLASDLSPAAASKRDELLTQMSNSIDLLKAQRLAMVSKGAEAGLTTSQIQAQRTLVSQMYDDMKDSLKDKEKRDILVQTLGRSEQGVKAMQADFAKAYPVLQVMKDTRMFDKVFDLSQTEQGRAALDRYFGPGFGNTMKSQVGSLPAWAERTRRAFNPQKFEELGPTSLIDPRAKTEDNVLDVQRATANMRLLGEKPANEWTEDNKHSAYMLAGNLGKTVGDVFVGKPENAAMLLKHGEATADKFMAQLTPQQRDLVGSQWERSGSDYVEQQMPNVQRQINELKSLDAMGTTQVRVVPRKDGQGLELELIRQVGTEPKRVLVNGEWQTKDFAPIPTRDAIDKFLRNDPVQDAVTKINHSLSKMHLAARSIALGSKYRGKAVDADQVNMMIRDKAMGTPLTERPAVVEQYSGKE